MKEISSEKIRGEPYIPCTSRVSTSKATLNLQVILAKQTVEQVKVVYDEIIY